MVLIDLTALSALLTISLFTILISEGTSFTFTSVVFLRGRPINQYNIIRSITIVAIQYLCSRYI